MDILPTEALATIGVAFKTLFLIAGGIIVLVSYFQAKEAKKMERKLRIALPGSVSLAMTAQLFLSILFLFVATVFFIFY